MPSNTKREGQEVTRFYRVAYDGAHFHGFQRQPDVATVGGTLLDALDQLGVQQEGWAAAGRTDAGVSAIGQTVRIRGPEWLTPSALNSRLPDTIWCWASTTVTPDAHPRYAAVERTYSYDMYVPECSMERVHAIGERLTGTHDFGNLSAASKDTKRTLTSFESVQDGPYVRLILRAPSFIHEQVRRIATLVSEYASGSRTDEEVDRILDPSVEIHGAQGIAPAPPEPLILVDVAYPDGLTFSPDEEAIQLTQAWFREEAILHSLRHRTTAQIDAYLDEVATDQYE